MAKHTENGFEIDACPPACALGSMKDYFRIFTM